MIAAGLGFLQSIIVVRTLGVKDYAVWVLATTYIGTITTLLDFRVWETVIKYLSEFIAAKDPRRALAMVKLAYFIDFATGILAFAVAVIAAPFAAQILGRPRLAEVAWIIGLSSLVITVNGSSNAILRVFDKFKHISVAEIATGVFSLLTVGVVAVLGYGLYGIAAGYVISMLVSALLLGAFALRTTREEFGHVARTSPLALLKSRFRELGKFLFHTNTGAIWGMIIRQFDVLVLGYFGTASDVSYFQLSKNIVSVLGKLSDPIYHSVFPEISKLIRRAGMTEFNTFLKKITVMMAGFFIPLAVAVFLLSGLIMRLAYGPDFIEAAHAIRIMVWGITLSCVFTWVRPTIIAIGKPQIGNLTGFINTIGFLAALALLVPKYGYIGAATAYLVPFVLGHTVLITYYLRYSLRHRERDIPQ